MLLTFSLADKIDPVAVYAAIVATLVLIWDVIKWLRAGPRLHGKAQGNMQIAGGYPRDSSSYIVFTVFNRGSANVTLTNLGIVAYASPWQRFRGKSAHTFIVNTAGAVGCSVPYVLKAGEQFMTLARQDDELNELSRTHRLYGQLFHSQSDSPLMLRIAPIPKEGAQSKQD